MLSPKEILDAVARLDTKTGIAKSLNLPAPRITELYKGDRKLSAEEAKKLYDRYNLEKPVNINVEMCALLVKHAANQFGIDPSGEALLEVAQDFRAFLKFASNPHVEESLAEGFLAGITSTHNNRLPPNHEH